MKKFLIASGVAVLAFATVAAAQGVTFTTNLTVGSTGPQVVALQTWLLANGHAIPALSSGVAAKGYFGSQTKAAVMKYQFANGIPNTGFVGPLTRAALNAGSNQFSNCPTGVTCTPNSPVTFVCP
ncbi:MAG: peptidoglycan-binding protein, partial [bacterium]|nr:peptidoglycan-binding protein [bacterium]